MRQASIQLLLLSKINTLPKKNLIKLTYKPANSEGEKKYKRWVTTAWVYSIFRPVFNTLFYNACIAVSPWRDK